MTRIADGRRAQELVATHPRLAINKAEGVLRAAVAEGDFCAASVASRALGTAARDLGDLEGSRAHLRAAASFGRRSRDAALEGEARTSLAAVYLLAGKTTAALRQASLAEPLARGHDLARLHAQRALIHQRLGHNEEALKWYGVALAGLSGPECSADIAKLLGNRAILLAYGRELDAAEADLLAAERLYLRLGAAAAAADMRHNLGFVAAQRGDIPAALNSYERADREFRRLGVLRPSALLDRCQALLDVGLAAEAHELARAAAHHFDRAGNELDLAEARLVQAEAALLDGDAAESIEVVALARLAFVRQRRPAWAALARYQFLRATSQSGLGPTSVGAVRTTARELAAHGWVVQAADARVIAARLALDRGQQQSAEAELEKVAPHRRRGPAHLRARAWHAEALLRLERGHRRGALAALRQGLSVLDEYRASLGASELRVHSAAAAAELVTLGLGLALETRRPASVLAWAERFRATSLRVPSLRPPADPELAERLARHRQVASELQVATLAGSPTDGLRLELAGTEREIRRWTRTMPGQEVFELRRPPSVGALSEVLGEHALVEYVTFAGDLWAVSVAGQRARLWRLGRVAEVRGEVDQLRFAVTRLVRGRDRPALVTAAVESLQYAARRLDDVLVAPLAKTIGGRQLVIVPTGLLHAVPWGMLPSMSGRAFTVAPSAGRWLTARARPRRPPQMAALVAGPGLKEAAAEVSAVAALYERSISLVDRGATVERALSAFGTSDLAHLAAHGHFRVDNPFFSSLQLADGPLTIYDLESVARVPTTIVLSTCEGGRAAVAPGDELIGLAASLLSLGATTVVGSPLTVPDESTRALMMAFHSRLKDVGQGSGLSPSQALAAAQCEVREQLGDDLEQGLALAAVGGFTCFGAG